MVRKQPLISPIMIFQNVYIYAHGQFCYCYFIQSENAQSAVSSISIFFCIRKLGSIKSFFAKYQYSARFPFNPKIFDLYKELS